MNITDLKAGTRLELEIRERDNEQEFRTFVSEFEWMQEDGALVIAAPIYEGNVYPVRIGTPMNVYFSQKDGEKAGQFRFKARVTGRGVIQNLAMLKIVMDSRIESIQRRQYFRQECSAPIQFRVVDTMNPAMNKGIPFIASITRDLSGGGLCMYLEEKIDKDELVECELTLEEEIVRFYGKVLRVTRLETEGKFKFEAGIAFRKIENKEREAVIKYIFKEQRKLRKKGLI